LSSALPDFAKVARNLTQAGASQKPWRTQKEPTNLFLAANPHPEIGDPSEA